MDVAIRTWMLGATILALAATSCKPSPASSSATSLVDDHFTPDQIERIETLSPLPEPPDDPTNEVSGDPDAAHFGQFLFYDERLSGDGSVSCASCHDPRHGFSVPTRLGHGMETTPRHPPTLLNTAHQRWYDWDGKADSLWAQAVRPLENPDEHGTSRTAVVQLVYETPELRRAYREVFGAMPETLSNHERFPERARPVPGSKPSPAQRAWNDMSESDRRLVNRVFSNVLKAIAAYEEQLTTGPAPFDRYVAGLESRDDTKLDALSPSAKRGLELFVDEAGCIRCHNGPNFSDETFHNLGLGSRPWLRERDPGRYRGVELVQSSPFNATGPYSDAREGREADRIEFLHRTSESRGQFKTPTLRNVELTAPYMHGGHFDTLEEVVRFYSALDEMPTIGHREEMLKPLGLTDGEVDDLVAFLRSLTGDPPDPSLMRQPDSPVPPDDAK